MPAPSPSAVRGPGRDRDVALAVAAGGALGAAGRYGVNVLLPHTAGTFPWATFLVNVTGCLLVGVLMVCVVEAFRPHALVRPFLGTGVLGGWTTFSAYAVEARDLLAGGHPATAAAYLGGSLVAGLAATWLAVRVTRRVVRR